MGNRPRRTNLLIGEVIIDELAYSQNIGSKNARKIIDRSEQVHVELWYDKHYVNRAQFGDEDGKRDGIGEQIIQELVSNSLRHMIYYAFRVKGFSFVVLDKPNVRSVRVVLQKETQKGLLNVAVGFHHITANKYEVTVYTAMVTDTFRLSDGQYTVLINDTSSILHKMDNNKLIEIDKYNEK